MVSHQLIGSFPKLGEQTIMICPTIGNDPINWWRHSKVFVRSGNVVMLWVDGWGVTNCDSLRCKDTSSCFYPQRHFSVQRTTTFVVPSADCSHQQKDLFCVITWVPWLSIHTLHGRGWPLKTTHEHNKRANGKTYHTLSFDLVPLHVHHVPKTMLQLVPGVLSAPRKKPPGLSYHGDLGLRTERDLGPASCWGHPKNLHGGILCVCMKM